MYRDTLGWLITLAGLTFLLFLMNKRVFGAVLIIFCVFQCLYQRTRKESVSFLYIIVVYIWIRALLDLNRRSIPAI